MDLSIVIVNYNTKELCRQTVESIFDSTVGLSYEIIVVDNSDNKNEVFTYNDHRVRVFSGLPNKGFGTASNYGAKKALGRYILFLNSDTIMQKDTLRKSVEYMDSHRDTGCLGIRTLREDGEFDHGCKRGFPTPFNSFCYFLKLDRLFPKNKGVGGYRLTYIDENETSEVECVSGAFMLMPKAVFEITGGFDEGIFMHGEDLDLCYRIKNTGKKVVYFADVFMIHLKGKSGLYTKGIKSIKCFYDGITYVYDKYYKKSHGKIGTLLFHGAIKTMCGLTIIKHYIKIGIKFKGGN